MLDGAGAETLQGVGFGDLLKPANEGISSSGRLVSNLPGARGDMLVGILFKLERGFASDSCRIVPVDVSVAIRQAGKFTPSM
uniref:Uncharacterized protein n=1 Tax=Rhizobium meliloti TaxID=382 RepID=A0A0D4DD02_RHIML|nr:hypothetical protein [Sinorhizobium meliloti]AJT61567.1 hypothetical protein [Sinorhizobium meliloti]